MHTAAKTTPQMQKKVANPKAIHGTTRMTVAGGFGIPSVSSGEVQQGTTLCMVVQYMFNYMNARYILLVIFITMSWSKYCHNNCMLMYISIQLTT